MQTQFSWRDRLFDIILISSPASTVMVRVYWALDVDTNNSTQVSFFIWSSFVGSHVLRSLDASQSAFFSVVFIVDVVVKSAARVILQKFEYYRQHANEPPSLTQPGIQDIADT